MNKLLYLGNIVGVLHMILFLSHELSQIELYVRIEAP